MLYSKEINKAINIMCEAHKGVMDRSGIPYIFHPYHVAEQMKTEDSTIAALLHDVVEDTDWTFEMLERMGVSERVIDALKLLTHKNGIPYMEYVKPIKDNKIAREVKIGDLKHNMDRSRLCGDIPENLEKRYKLYQEALSYLES